MIYTLTMNPAIDMNITTKGLKRGLVNRTFDTVYTPNGKGVNVTLTLKHFGEESVVTGFFGGFSGNYVVTELENRGVKVQPIWVEDTTRINIFLNDGDGELKFVNSGATVNEDQQYEMIQMFEKADDCECIAISGSLPPGIQTTYYESILSLCKKRGIDVVLDISSSKLKDLLKYEPLLIKPNDEEIEEFIGIINRIAQDHPILVDKYLQGKEIEVDAVCDGTDILIPGIMEHIERAGIHSGDSISVYPAQSLTEGAKAKIAEYTRRLAKSLHVIGMINIQFIVCGEDDVYVIEVNPRSSRTVPYISKVTGIPIVPLATQVITGKKIKDLGYTPGLQPEADYVAVKMPVFSFEKIRGADISLGPEMKSTGECLGIAKTFDEALYKAFIGAGIKLPKHKNMIMTVRDEDHADAVEIGRRFEKIGYHIFATSGTARALNEAGVKATPVRKIEQESPNLLDLILGHKIDLVIDIPAQGAEHSRDGFVIRRNAIETGVNVLTAIDTAYALITSLENTDIKKLSLIDIAKVQ